MSKSPVNKRLYQKVKSEAKKKFSVYPSAYANAWLAKRYKELGGKYDSKKKTTISYLTKSRKRKNRKSSRKKK